MPRGSVDRAGPAGGGGVRREIAAAADPVPSARSVGVLTGGYRLWVVLAPSLAARNINGFSPAITMGPT